MIAAKAVMDSLLEHAADVESLAVLSRFRRDSHACFTARADELFELADAVLCADGPVETLAGLSLAPEHRRGHGALYNAVTGGVEWRGCAGRWPGFVPRAAGAADAGRRREQLAAARRGDQPGAAVLPCLRAGEGPGADDPGLAVLGDRGAGAGPHLWTAVLDAVRLGPMTTRPR